ncbi:MAG: L-fucose:H+ symporter permease [Terracidiphilus sp.]
MPASEGDRLSSQTAPPHVKPGMFPLDHRLLFALVTVLFFLWGMSNNLTDILVQQFKKSFELTQLSAQLVQTANFLGYFCMAIPAALLMRRWGYKTGMIAGMATFGTGMVLFWPAAMSGVYLPFLFALFMVGCGASMLETACNPFMAQFGPAETSERRLNFVQSFNPPGTIVGVIIGARFIFSGIELKQPQIAAMRSAGTYAAYLHAERMRVVPTYIALGLVVLSFALLLSRIEFPTITSEHEQEAGDHGSFRALLHYPHLWLAVVANFCNVGAQVATWSALIPYMKQFTGVTERVAAGYLTATLVAMALGRFVGTQLMRFISASKLMGIYAIINIGLLAFAIARPGLQGAYAIVYSSFFLSIMFPTTFALGVKGLGPNTKLAGSFLVMAVAGGAVFPPILGWIARQTGSVAQGYIVPLLGYVAVAFYGLMVRHTVVDSPPAPH